MVVSFDIGGCAWKQRAIGVPDEIRDVSTIDDDPIVVTRAKLQEAAFYLQSFRNRLHAAPREILVAKIRALGWTIAVDVAKLPDKIGRLLLPVSDG